MLAKLLILIGLKVALSKITFKVWPIFKIIGTALCKIKISLMKKTLNNTKRIGLAAIFILITISYLLLFYNLKQMSKQNVLIAHTDSVILNLHRVVTSLSETGDNYRGSILFNDDAYVEKYYTSVIRSKNTIKQLQELTKENPSHKQLLDSLANILFTRYNAFENAINYASIQKPPPGVKDSLLKIGYNNEEMDLITAGMAKIEDAETAALKTNTENVKKFSSLVGQINFVSLVLVLVLGYWSIITFRKESAAKKLANQHAEQYKLRLEKKYEDLAEANIKINELKSEEKFASTGRITHVIAHEIRNPLTNINLATEQLKEDIEPTEESGMLLQMITRNSLRINQLISDLLNATKFTELQFLKENVINIIEESLKHAADRLQLKHVRVNKYYEKPNLYISAEKNKLQIALFNILINGIEALPNEGGVITISVQQEENKIEIIIEDNGKGMTEDVIQNLFEPFFTNKKSGNGLGLTNTQNIILNHKGSIRVESEIEEGTRFIILLPAAV